MKRQLHIFGDSYGAGQVLGDQKDLSGWPRHLCCPGVEIINHAKCGAFMEDIDDQIASAGSLGGSTVILSASGNDVMRAASDNIVNAAEALEMSSRFVWLLGCISGAARRYVFTYPDPFDGTNKRVSCALAYLNALIVRMSAFCGASSLPLHEWLQGEHFDGQDIHPNTKGHCVIAAQISKRLMYD